MHQQIALGQKAGKPHAVPVLVGDLGDQVGGGLAAIGRRSIAQRTAMGAQVHAQLLLGGGGVGLWRCGTDRQGLQCLGSAVLGHRASLGHGGLRDAPVFAGE